MLICITTHEFKVCLCSLIATMSITAHIKEPGEGNCVREADLNLTAETNSTTVEK